MTTHKFDANELVNVGDTEDVILRKALDAGYTNVTVTDVNMSNSVFLITFDEADNKSTTLTNLEAATEPVLSVSSSAVEIVGDGVATGSVTLSDSRGASASGKVVTLLMNTPGAGLVLSGGESYTLDASGNATVNFGASPVADWVTGEITICFHYASGEADLCEMTVRYTA